MEVQQSSPLEPLVQKVGEAVLATTDTVEKLAEQMDVLTKQVQQQGYQIFALSDTVQTLAENQDAALEQLGRLTEVLERLVRAIEDADEGG